MFLIFLAETKKSPPFQFFGASGRGHTFRWSEEHRKMILEGRVLSVADFAKLAPEIFGADPEVNAARPIPQFLGGQADSTTLRLPPFSGGELMRIAARIGELEIENASLRKGFVPAPRITPEAPTNPAAVEPPKVTGLFDPDEAPAHESPAPPTPVAAKRRTPPVPPAQPVAPPESGMYDPDEVGFNTAALT